MLRLTTCALIGALALTGCRIHTHGSAYIVDGVRLDEKHQETLAIGEWDPAGLELMVSSGDVRFETGSNTTITLDLHEVTEGDATASYEGGRIVLETRSGEPAAIGDVVIRTATAIPHLDISTGMGDLDGRDVHVTGEATLGTGMGDLELFGLTVDGPTTMSTGMGDLDARDCTFGRLIASSGMGDLDLTSVQAGDAAISSGMGDVDVEDSAFARLEIDTGMGDVDLSNTQWQDADFDTGIGSVSKD
jgi:hypothetical protein